MKLNRSQGFTVLEMLVVMALIMFLMGFIVSQAVAQRHLARVNATKALIQQVGIGMTQYYAAFREYPPDTGFGLPRTSGNAGVTYDPGSIWRYLCQPLKDSSGKVVHLDVNFPTDNLVQYNDPVHGPSFYLVDSWGSPIGFTSDRRRIVHNPGGVDVFSPGPDKVTASDDSIDNGRFFNVANSAYDGSGSDDASELGEAVLNGTLSDDLNNWSLK